MSTTQEHHDVVLILLGELKAGQLDLRREMAEAKMFFTAELEEVKTIASDNRRDIAMAKGGSVFATLACAIVGAIAYFR